MRVKVTLPSRRELELQNQTLRNRNDSISNLYAAQTLELKKLKDDLHRQRYQALTNLIDSIATINRSLATVTGEAGAFITK